MSTKPQVNPSSKHYRVTFILKTGGRRSGGEIIVPAWWSEARAETHARQNSMFRNQIRDVELDAVDADAENDDSDDAVTDALREHMSPNALAIVAACLQVAPNYAKPEYDADFRQVAWLEELCRKVSAGSPIGRDGL